MPACALASKLGSQHDPVWHYPIQVLLVVLVGRGITSCDWQLSF